MTDRLQSPPPARSASEGIRAWMELVQLGDELVQASFRRQYGEHEWIEPYRKWSEKSNQEKDRRLESMLRRLAVAETQHG